MHNQIQRYSAANQGKVILLNLLIVSDKSDVKLYQSIAKTASNVSVLGAVTKIDSDFISTVRDKYNPHAIMLDTDTPVVGTDIKTVIEKIPPEYSYMKILVLTSEDDDYEYPVDCVVQGQVSNLKLKDILTSMANGSALPEFKTDESRSYFQVILPIHPVFLREEEPVEQPVRTERRRSRISVIEIIRSSMDHNHHKTGDDPDQVNTYISCFLCR